MHNKQLNVGIIGYGKMGRLRESAVEKRNFAKVISIYDPNNEAIESVKYKDSAESIIHDKSIDVIFICTPNYKNFPLTKMALGLGKHVFCEKPPTFTANEMREIRQVESVSGKKLMYGFNHRHHESIIKMKEMVDSKHYGRILWMRGRYGKSVDTSFYSTWRSQKKYSGGGILMDQGIHMVDLFLHLAGQFDESKSYLSNLYWQGDVEDNAFVTLRNTKTGVLASLHSTMTQWRHLFSLEVFLEKGYMVLNGLKTSSGTYGDETLTVAKSRSTAPAATWEDESHYAFHVDNSWDYEVEHFFNAIANNKPIETGCSKDALELMTLLDEIYKEPILNVSSPSSEDLCR
ncbi:MAG: Gfo/Idh/MocA family oxidoreductase [Gammaproteobacteria bacterium]|nr:Gfo/Idh/MocA family oxidoreductase [Gammaproteobacteria bacterium]